ncbi:MAG: MATE family efflux transporter [Acidobacteria bacterium]|nr:MATE family efflux transporter [Acidobacteriota bacterium]MCA1612079.1 MATE family efflux transporter [Acidobacteriota bacterium]
MTENTLPAEEIRPAVPPAPGAPTPKLGRRFDRSIVEGPIGSAVWRLAWPTMLQNVIAGLQGIVDHAMVGHYVGYTGNAAIGVSWQIVIVVIVFINSLFTGMAVLVARFAGADEPEKVNRVVYQAFLTAIGLSAVMGAVGYFAAPALLGVIHAAPEVQREALPFLRAMFLGIVGMMLFYMLSGAFRAAGDTKTPLRLGVAMTVLTVLFNILLIPRLGTVGAAYGTIASSTLVAAWGIWRLFTPRSVIHFPRDMTLRPDFTIIRSLFRFGLPSGVQGIAMNVAGVLLLRFIGSLAHSAAAQAAFAVGYTELFSLITWTSVGLMGASATIAGQNLGAGKPDRAIRGVAVASRIGLGVAVVIGGLFLAVPSLLLGIFGMTEPLVTSIGTQLLRYLSVSGLFITVALSYTGGLQGSGDTKSPLYISIVSQIVVPIGLCSVLQSMRPLQPADIWLAIVLGHMTRAILSFVRFRQGKWRHIAVDIGRPSS